MTAIRPSQIRQAGASVDDVLAWDGTEWAPGAPSGGGSGDPSWTTPGSYSNSWVAFGSPYASPGYRKLSSGLVLLRGLAKSGTGTNPSIFTLPSGYRPGAQQFFTTTSNGNLQTIEILTNGTVQVTSPYSNVYVSLDGISFYADA